LIVFDGCSRGLPAEPASLHAFPSQQNFLPPPHFKSPLKQCEMVGSASVGVHARISPTGASFPAAKLVVGPTAIAITDVRLSRTFAIRCDMDFLLAWCCTIAAVA
jgi:hypothetical protein